jgi:hypothetical protein
LRQRCRIEPQRVRFAEIFGGWNERDQPVISLFAFIAGDPRKQMPERQRIAHAGFGQHGCERIRFVACKIEPRQRLLKLLRGVFKIRRAETSIRLRPAERARRDERFAPVARQRHPA